VHELSLVEELLRIVSEHAPDRLCVRQVHVIVGPLSGVWPDALQFAFDELAHEHGFANAALVIHQRPAECTCSACGIRYETVDVHGGCPTCGALDRTIESGDEFRIDSIEVEDEG
jgi:hydrogenase nickel incorporation protein HypA/HybF